MFVNLTPHAIMIRPITLPFDSFTADQFGPAEAQVRMDEECAKGTHDLVIPPSGAVARVATAPGKKIGEMEGVPIFDAPQMGTVEGLPDPAPNTIYIVSSMVAGACPGRTDVVSPGTGPADGAIRDGGQIVAVTRLVRAPDSGLNAPQMRVRAAQEDLGHALKMLAQICRGIWTAEHERRLDNAEDVCRLRREALALLEVLDHDAYRAAIGFEGLELPAAE